MNYKQWFFSLSIAFGLVISTQAADEEGLFSTKSLTPETAFKAAHAALDACRKDGYTVAVAVVDRSGVIQVILRDRHAGIHTPDTARRKAWSAVSFRTNTSDLVELSNAGGGISGLGFLPNVAMLGGGKYIEAAGSIVAGIGVSGAPGGKLDDACVDAGIEAIEEDIEF